MGNSSKICLICGEDCSQRPRIKDPKGRYYCKGCHEEALREKRARAEAAPDQGLELSADDGPGMMAEVLEQVESAAPAAPGLEAGDPFTGGAALPVSPEPRQIDPRMVHRRAISDTARATVRAEYVKPLVLLVGGVAVTMIAVMGFGASVGAASGGGLEGAAGGSAVGAAAAMFLVVQLLIGSVITAALFWLAGKMFLGDLGPAHLILLRVAGIHATVLAVLTLTVAAGLAGSLGLSCFGLLVAVGCAFGLTMWLFELSFLQVVLLIVFLIAVQFVIGLILPSSGPAM